MKQEITIPKGTEKISIEQFDNRIVIELIPKCKFKDGDVVFDSKANTAELDNHYKRPEVVGAFASGIDAGHSPDKPGGERA